MKESAACAECSITDSGMSRCQNVRDFLLITLDARTPLFFPTDSVDILG